MRSRRIANSSAIPSICSIANALHVAVVAYFIVKRRTRRIGVHLLSPAIGFAVILFVLINADVNAKVGGLAWLAIGIAIALRLAGRSTELRLEA